LNQGRTGQKTQEFASFPFLPEKEDHVNCAIIEKLGSLKGMLLYIMASKD